jgi:hypothetical protein
VSVIDNSLLGDIPPRAAKWFWSRSRLDLSGPFGSVANFQTIATGILEKDGIVTRPFIESRPFDIPPSCPDNDLSQSVHLAGAVCQEGDPALVGDMLWRLSDAKKLGSTLGSGRFELQPALDPDVARKPERRQECLIEGACLSKTTHSQVNVIVPPPHVKASQW